MHAAEEQGITFGMHPKSSRHLWGLPLDANGAKMTFLFIFRSIPTITAIRLPGQICVIRLIDLNLQLFVDF